MVFGKAEARNSDKICLIKQVLEEKEEIVLVILYGSFYSGKNNEKSDIDVAVAGEEILSSNLMLELYLELGMKTRREIDLLDLNKVHGTILKEILTKGIVLKKTNISVYANLIIKMLDYEEDMAPNVRYIIDRRIERFLNGE